VLSLSGGADSSAVACLVALMAELGAGELGVEGFVRKLGHPKSLVGARTARDLVHGLLTCAWQPTDNSGSATRDAARTVAEAVGAPLHELEVGPIVRAYVALVERAIGRPLDWQRDDTSLQNIQARVRAPSVWLLANVEGKLLVSTSNRSEAAVGYATMDGDTAGGLAPIAGIDKAWLRQWLRWLEREGPHGLHPVPALSVVNRLAPTAELRPPGAHQTDEDDLMPYDVLDAVERAAIRDKLSPVEVLRVMRVRFPQHPTATMAQWIERFFRLFAARQWKRERYAPSFHLDDENLDPKTWCRFPILNGGYERELAALREAAAKGV
jgi:NAD+ synthase (glutamine-hydrolysing)